MQAQTVSAGQKRRCAFIRFEIKIQHPIPLLPFDVTHCPVSSDGTQNMALRRAFGPVRSVKEECLSKLILFGEPSLRRALTEFIDHFHVERNHQGKG
jgi:hypothetical protein